MTDSLLRVIGAITSNSAIQRGRNEGECGHEDSSRPATDQVQICQRFGVVCARKNTEEVHTMDELTWVKETNP
jgi:hypothetical protein